ncbi:MAG: VWA domain-containing protein [Myxococcales bacterium]|nr:VWA domain-containing protein [Myxococcota bacterium]MDW8281907.1 VWA domain-containing protein [Myxococcales bacterium]
MPPRALVAALFLCAALHLDACPAAAQGVRVHLERVGLEAMPRLKAYVTVTEPDGTVVTSRRASDFRLIIDGKEISQGDKMAFFERAKEPVYVVAVVQVSPAMEPALDAVKQGLRKVADSLTNIPSARMGVLAYAGSVQRLLDGGTAAEVGAALSRLAIEQDAPPEVRMLESLRVAMDILRGQERGRRKIVLLFSDGIDEKLDKEAFNQVGQKAAQEGIVISTIGYGPFEPGRLKSLIELSRTSGGTARGCKSIDEIGGRFESFVQELLRQYVIFFPPMGGDNQEHAVQVRLVDAKAPPSPAIRVVLPVVEGHKPLKPAGGCSWF